MNHDKLINQNAKHVLKCTLCNYDNFRISDLQIYNVYFKSLEFKYFSKYRTVLLNQNFWIFCFCWHRPRPMCTVYCFVRKKQLLLFC